MKYKRMISLLLASILTLGLLSGYSNSQAEQAHSMQSSSQTLESNVQAAMEPNAPVSEEKAETARARDLGLLPDEWESNLSDEADFTGFDKLITSLILLCDEKALPYWQQNVDSSAFPQRTMLRDDGLVLLMLAAETLGYNTYNARAYGFCTENFVDYDSIFSQISWDYPYCDTEREIPMYFEEVGGDEDPIGNAVSSAVFWMQRRMDLKPACPFP